ncbi:MAG: DUF3857 domain-containing protein [Ignavibacteria bacterium]|nr:DUF3857 domain-containing protein [Ignavibacteria bacterium]
MHTSKTFSMVIIICALTFLCMAQEPPIKWGEIPRADLEMNCYTPDSNAAAVVLCNYGEAYIDDDVNCVLNVHQRIKIMSEKGYTAGTIKLIVYGKKNYTTIKNIEACTYKLNESNEIVKLDLQKKDIYEQNLHDGFTELAFTMPGLSSGCIIDLRYTKIFKTINIPVWDFQSDYPVRYSEFRVSHPNVLQYSTVTHGYEDFVVRENHQGQRKVSGLLGGLLGITNLNETHYRWAVKNAPALKAEPFITTVHDYANQVEFHLLTPGFLSNGRFHLPSIFWSDFLEDYIESPVFGEAIDHSRNVKKIATQLTAGITKPMDKVKVIHEWTSKRFICEESHSPFCNEPVEDLIEKQKGSPSEINFVSLSLLMRRY